MQVFVANPEKPPEIAEILAANKKKLIAFLQGFQNEKGASFTCGGSCCKTRTGARLRLVIMPRVK